MEIRLRPEIEALIRQDVERGPYQTVDEFVERAITLLHEQESWLAGHRTEIQTQIAAGYAAAQRGEFIEGDEVRSRLNELRGTRRGEQPRK